MSGNTARIIQGDCRSIMRSTEPESVDAIICDPPYEISFMNRSWDGKGVSFDPATWRACYRVLKPGGYLLAMGGTRTYHRIAVAIEDAGFEIRDTLSWLYGSGFPKSMDIAKAIDKEAGVEREVVGRRTDGRYAYDFNGTANRPTGGAAGTDDARRMGGFVSDKAIITAPATPEAEQWQGWGTALKPACELICMARRPLAEKTVAANVLKYGTGAINVDSCRIEGGERPHIERRNDKGLDGNVYGSGINGSRSLGRTSQGRWPTNVVLDKDAAEILDEMSGVLTSGGGNKRSNDSGMWAGKRPLDWECVADRGGASRFFKVVAQDDEPITRFLYTSKASRAERNAGLDGMPKKQDRRFGSGGRTQIDGVWTETHSTPKQQANHHPTVKPLSLTRWLIRMVTPPGGTALDPFAGSGTTGVAALKEGFNVILIEQEAEYIPIIEARIKHEQNRNATTE